MTTKQGASGEGRSLVVLMVDDDETCHELLRRAMRSVTSPEIELRIAADGEAALAQLPSGDGGAGAAGAAPDLVLLDMNVPLVSGLQLLQHVQALPPDRRPVVVVLSGSERGGDVQAAYAAGAQGYVVKPVGAEAFRTAMRTILDYWLNVVTRRRR